MTRQVGTIEVPRQYCGPPNSGNGGYVSGLLASFLDGPVRVRLIAPTPLDTSIEIVTEGDGIAAYAGKTKIGIAAPAEVEVFEAAPAAPAYEEPEWLEPASPIELPEEPVEVLPASEPQPSDEVSASDDVAVTP